jgi:hypothetical protein
MSFLLFNIIIVVSGSIRLYKTIYIPTRLMTSYVEESIYVSVCPAWLGIIRLFYGSNVAILSVRSTHTCRLSGSGSVNRIAITICLNLSNQISSSQQPHHFYTMCLTVLLISAQYCSPMEMMMMHQLLLSVFV